MTRIRAALALACAAVCALAATAPLASGAVALTPVGTFQRPVFITAPPNDVERVFVVERQGVVRLLVNGVVQPTPYLDIRGFVATSDGIGEERGLLSMAFAPDFASSGKLYVFYVGTALAAGEAGENGLVIDEYRAAAPSAATVDPATRRRVIAVAHPIDQNHNGGQIAFGPDGMLYIGTGDGGGGGDPRNNGQNATTLLGKILRVDVRSGATANPPDNPYPATAGPRTPVWAIGLRNPYRFSFDRLNGDLTIGDVGQGRIEEVNYLTKASGLGRAANYGWNTLEGRLLYPSGAVAQPSQYPAGNVLPVIEHDRQSDSEWCSVIGGFVVRDPELPDLLGKYVYGDFCKGQIWSATLGPTGATGDAATGLTVETISSFGEDGCGRIYVASINGEVSRLSDSGRCAGPAPVPFSTAPTAPGDTSAPGVTLVGSARQKVSLRRPIVRVRIACNERCAVRATGRLIIGTGKNAKAVFLVPASRQLLAGQNPVVALAIPKRSRAAVIRALQLRRPVRVTVTVLARDDAQNRTLKKKAIQVTLARTVKR
jgi:glucose/arabinose dehydrogenase